MLGLDLNQDNPGALIDFRVPRLLELEIGLGVHLFLLLSFTDEKTENQRFEMIWPKSPSEKVTDLVAIPHDSS